MGAQPQSLRDHRGRTIRLGAHVATGGEGSIYFIEGDPTRVAKLYVPKVPVDAQRVAKLDALVTAFSANLGKVAAWPDSTLFDSSSKVVGFTMPRLSGFHEVHELYGPTSRPRVFPRADWLFLLHVAAESAAVVDEVHAAGHVVGDINAKNIMVSAAGFVCLVDCDSFTVNVGGRSYPCLVGVPEFTPPELQGLDLSQVTRTPDHDCFGLAVLVFQLLFLGRHPFAGVPPKGSPPASMRSVIRDRRFAYGSGAPGRGIAQPPMTLPLDAVPPNIAGLFERAFLKAPGGAPRPSAAEWCRELRALKANVKSCGLESHKYPGHLNDCPWCGLIQVLGKDVFAGNLHQLLVFQCDPNDIHALWLEIERDSQLPTATVPNSPPRPPGPLPAGALDARTRLQRAGRGVTWYGWTMALSALPVLATPWAWIGPALASIGMGATFIRLRALRRANPYVAGKQRLDSAASAAQTSAREAIRQMNARMDAARNTLQQLQVVARRARDAYVTLRRRYEEHLHALERTQRDTQRRDHLERHFVRDAQIDKVGAGRKRSLVGYGIETAYDVLNTDLTTIPGFGPQLRDNLRLWADGVAASFVFDPKRGLSDADKHNAVLIFRREQTHLRSALEVTAKGIKMLRESTVREIAVAQQTVQAAQDHWVSLAAEAETAALAAADHEGPDGLDAQGRAALQAAAQAASYSGRLTEAEFISAVTGHEEFIERYQRSIHEIARRDVVLRTRPGPGGASGPTPDPAAIDPWTVSPAQLPTTSRVTCTCPNCRGSKAVACSRCGGSGRTGCGYCGGSGTVSSQRRPYYKKCPSCRGRGDERCGVCRNGQVDCSDCMTSGMVTAWLEISETSERRVLVHPPEAKRLHKDIAVPNDFDNPNGWSSTCVADTGIVGQGSTLPSALVPSLSSRRERFISARGQTFETRVHRFAYRIAGSESQVEVSGSPAVVANSTSWPPLDRRRNIGIATWIFGLPLVAGLVAAERELSYGQSPLYAWAVAALGVVALALFGAWVKRSTLGPASRRRPGSRALVPLAVLCLIAAAAVIRPASQRAAEETERSPASRAFTSPSEETTEVAKVTTAAQVVDVTEPETEQITPEEWVVEALRQTVPPRGQPAEAAKLMKQVAQKVKAGDLAGAEQLSVQALAIDPTHIASRYERARLAAIRGEAEVALNDLVLLRLIGTWEAKKALLKAKGKDFTALKTDPRLDLILNSKGK